MIGLFDIVFISLIASVLCSDCSPGTNEPMTCFTPCSNEPSVKSYCLQTSAAEYLFDGRIYNPNGDLLGKELSALEREEKCSCVMHIPSMFMAAVTDNKLTCNIDLYECEDQFPKCTIKNVNCKSAKPADCREPDSIATSFPNSTIICSGGSSYLVPASDQEICKECLFSPKEIGSSCSGTRCKFALTFPIPMGFPLPDGAEDSYEVYWCANDVNLLDCQV